MALCKSEKNDACIGFGTIVTSETDHFDLPDQEWIIDGIGDSFWENYEEFELGVKQAIALMSKDQTISRQNALFSIFGHFSICYEVDSKTADLHYNIDTDEIMYSMLEQLCENE
jgi:hypothetical protein